jgi:hypothetical protein
MDLQTSMAQRNERKEGNVKVKTKKLESFELSSFPPIYKGFSKGYATVRGDAPMQSKPLRRSKGSGSKDPTKQIQPHTKRNVV